MEKVNVSFRLDPESVAFLDTLGAHLERDRSYLINDAVKGYIEMHRYHVEEIRRGIAAAEAGEFASTKDVRATFKRLTREG